MFIYPALALAESILVQEPGGFMYSLYPGLECLNCLDEVLPRADHLDPVWPYEDLLFRPSFFPFSYLGLFLLLFIFSLMSVGSLCEEYFPMGLHL